MSKKLNFIVPLVVYPFDIMVCIGQSDEQLKTELDKFGVDWDDKFKCSGMGRCVMTDSNQTLLRLWSYPETNEDMGTLQHELFHAISMVMDEIGMPLVVGTSCEAYAYLTGYLTKEIYNRL
jgi:hypothetical protein